MGEVIIIAAMAENNVIGKDNTIPWHYPEDFKHFKDLTSGHTVVMGRKTWESLPKRPLPNRTNVVITRNKDYEAPGATLASSLPDALAMAKQSAQNVYLIGGKSIYEEGLSHADKLELTRVHQEVEGDTHFPEVNYDNWNLVNEEHKGAFSFQTHERK